jgi:phage terminase large subunit
MVLCFTPGGIGTEFLRRVFHLKQYKGNERSEDFAFIQAYGWDNFEWFNGIEITAPQFYVMSSEARLAMFVSQTVYGKSLDALPPALRVGELLGNFDKFYGQYFAGVWDEEKCVLGASRARAMIQPWWSCWMAQDWAFAEHACNLWFAAGKLRPEQSERYLGIQTASQIEVVLVYRELIVQEMAEADLAIKIVEMTPSDEQPERFWLSPDAFAKRGSANTVAQQFEEILLRHKFPAPEPADNDRVGGWRLLYNGFRQSSSLMGAIVDEERAKQGPLLLISADCPGLISSIPLAVRDEDNLEDVKRVSGALWEDCTDGLRYGYKSKLNAKSQAPYGIRLQEALAAASQASTTAAGINMNAVHMAHLEFQAKERQRSVISRGQRCR